MKNCKKILSAILVASMAFSLAGCSSVKAIDKKDFKNALKELKLDDDMREYKGDDIEYYGYDEDDIKYLARVWDDDQWYMFIQFEDTEAAHDYFEDEFYDDIMDVKEDKDFDGKLKTKLSKSSGYIILKGESESDDFMEGEVYGGIYFKNDVVVVALATSDKKSDIKDIDTFLKSIGYPKP